MNTHKHHSISQSIVLHLLPGLLITAGYIIFAPIMLKNGYPAILGLLVSFLVAGLPFQLGFVLIQIKKFPDSLSLKDIIYRNPMPVWQYFALVVGILVWGFLSSGIIGIPEMYFAESAFSWLPDWFAILSVEQFADFSRPELVTTFIFVIIVNWLLGPIIEDIYFRGYLMPRIPQSSKWVPLISTVLFSLYHFWVPWAFLSHLIAFYPITYFTWKKQNLYFNFIAHLSLNIVGGILLWLQILA